MVKNTHHSEADMKDLSSYTIPEAQDARAAGVEIEYPYVAIYYGVARDVAGNLGMVEVRRLVRKPGDSKLLGQQFTGDTFDTQTAADARIANLNGCRR